VKRILLTGMSGVGKSTVISQLTAHGYKAVDLDDPAWSQWVDSADGDGPTALRPGKDWVWREDRVRSLLETQGRHVLFVSGCAPNQGKFSDRFDAIILLSAPAAVMVHRLTHREGDGYGKSPDEVARSLEFKETIEPRLRSTASLEVDTSAPLGEVVSAILDHAHRPRSSHSRHD
jgi:broad-specificity NMP kinase